MLCTFKLRCYYWNLESDNFMQHKCCTNIVKLVFTQENHSPKGSSYALAAAAYQRLLFKMLKVTRSLQANGRHVIRLVRLVKVNGRWAFRLDVNRRRANKSLNLTATKIQYWCVMYRGEAVRRDYLILVRRRHINIIRSRVTFNLYVYKNNGRTV